MMTRRMRRRRVKNGEMLIKWKRSIWLDFFFLFFPPPRSIRWTVFLIVDRGNFHEVISLFSDRSDLCVCLCVCVYFNQSARRARRQRRSVNKTSFTNVQFIPILNQRLYPPDRLPPGDTNKNGRKREREKKKRPSSSACPPSHSLKKEKNKKSKIKSRPARLFGSAWPRQHWLSHDHTVAPHPACERAIGSPIDSVIALFLL